MLVLDGSEGGVPAETAEAIATGTGLVTFGLAYFKEAGLPRHLVEMPLDYVQRAAVWHAPSG